jgi:N6-adenosine-specific RNA methylase IME4
MSGADIFAGLKRHHYRAILGDPPWDFRTWSAKGSGRSAISHYDTMSFEQLAALPVVELAASDCALFLWAYDPLLHRAFELIAAWGFTFKTRAFTWAKTTRSGQGLCVRMRLLHARQLRNCPARDSRQAQGAQPFGAGANGRAAPRAQP